MSSARFWVGRICYLKSFDIPGLPKPILAGQAAVQVHDDESALLCYLLPLPQL